MNTTTGRYGAERRFVAGAAGALAAIVWTHGAAALTRKLTAPGPLAAVELTLLAAAGAVLVAFFVPRRRAIVAAFAGNAAAALALGLLVPGSGAGAVALVPAGVAAAFASRWIGLRLPTSIDGTLSRRRVATIAWGLLAVVALVQVGRLAVATTDREKPLFLTTENAFWYGHECIGAYLLAADLSANGEPDVYSPSHYLGLDPEAKPATTLEGVALEDPYQYPPPFLLLPRGALAVTSDVAAIRVVWFALQTTLFLVVAAWLALFVGGRSGRIALWLLPLVLASFPALHNLQFGQFHLPAIVLAVAAMLLFARGRAAVGGALLASAILAKMFPFVLVPYLLARKKFRELAWTAGFGAAIALVALAVLGTAPFTAFYEHHLPRLADGSAFAFDEAWPELADLVVVDNQGVYGLARKAGLAKPVAAEIGRWFGVLAMVAAFGAGLLRESSRAARAATWLGLIGLATLASPGAWGDYVPVTAVWLLTLVAAPLFESRAGRAAFAAVVLFEGLLLGTMPLGDWAPIGPMKVLSTIGAVLMLALFTAAVAAPRLAARAAGARLPRPRTRRDALPVPTTE